MRLFQASPLEELVYTSRFGEYRNTYRHEGTDFSCPVGTPIFAAHSGLVSIGNQEKYGLFVTIDANHKGSKYSGQWQTTYAHMDAFAVGEGNIVEAGQLIGYSGNTGNSTGPHLHFGLRVQPYDRNDSWWGYCNPEPHLEQLFEWPGALLGPHFVQGGAKDFLERQSHWQPATALFLDPNHGDVQEFRNASPNTIIIGRIYTPDGETHDRIMADPIAAAAFFVDKALANEAVAAGLIDYVQSINEVCQVWDELDALNACEMERMRLLESHGLKGAILGFSVGNPDLPENDRTAAWRKVYPALDHAEQNNHIGVLHQYGAPDLWGPEDRGGWDWHCGRLEENVLWRLPQRTLRWVVSEYGIDGLLLDQSEPSGWRNFTTASGYVDQLTNVEQYIRRFGSQIIGYNIFCLGPQNPWETYDIKGEVEGRLTDYYVGQRSAWPSPIETVPPTEPPVVTPPPIEPPTEPPVTMPPVQPEPPTEIPEIPGFELVEVKLTYRRITE